MGKSANPAKKPGKKKQAKRGHQGKALEPHTVALILSVAAKEGIPAAKERFGVAERTIHRYKLKVASGKWPEVAELVAAFRQEATERCKDLLTEVYEQALKTLREKMPNASYREVLETVDKTGGLKELRDALGDNDEPAAG
jgi:DNA-binding GntR family transcriptional regulator